MFALTLMLLATSPVAPIAATLDQPVTLRRSEAATHEKVIVIFTSVVSDSRCPPDVQCKWAGKVVVRLTASVVRGKPVIRELSLEPGRPAPSFEFEGYRVTLVSVESPPESVTLKLSR